MPYDITINGVTLRNVPDAVPRDDPKLQALAGQHALQQKLDTARADKQGPQFESARQRAEKAAQETLSDYDPGDKLMVNLGAGVSDLGSTLKQITGMGEQPSPADIAEKRRIDDALAGTGLAGFGWRGVQDVGRTLGVAAIPSRRVLTGAVQGGLTGAVEPTMPGESRAVNTLFGTGIGAGVPFLAGSTQRTVGPLLRGSATAAARQEIEQALEGASPQTRAQATGQPVPRGVTPPDNAPNLPFGIEFPYTPAARAGDAGLARLEKGSRARNPAEYYAGDVERAKALRDAILQATAEAEELGARKQGANQGWKNDWQAVKNTVDPADFTQGGAMWRQHLEDLKLHGEAEDPDVMAALNFLSDRYDLHAAKGTLTPEHVQTWRRILNEGGDQTSQNALKRADPSSFPIAQLKNDLDDWLNTASAGNWQTVLNNYTQASRAIDQAKAAGRVRSKWWELGEGSNLPVRTRGTTVDPGRDVPQITEAGLSGAQDLAMGSNKISQLSPQAQQALAQTMDVLARQGLAGKVARSGTLGGSDTALNFMSMLDQKLLGAVPGLASISPVIGPAMAARRESLGGLQKTLVDQALSDPVTMNRLMKSPAVRPEVKQAIVDTLMATGRISGGEAMLQSSRKDEQSQ